MFNPKVAMQALKKPFIKLTRAVIQAKLKQWQKQDPQLYQEALELVNGKSDEQLRTIANDLSKELGIDFAQLAEAFGYKV